MAKLCPKGKAAAKRKFKVYPSAYANMYASGVCSGKIKPGGRKKAMGGGLMTRPMMKKGGVATEAKKRQFRKNQAGSIKMAKKVLTDNLAGDIYKDKRVRKFASKVKEGLKNSPLNLKRGAEGYINLGKKVIQKVKDRTKKMGGGLMTRPMYKGGGLCTKGMGRAYGKNS
jgi:hypothetical protein